MPARRSKAHVATLEVLREIFPGARIIEDYTIKPKRGKVLYLDLYIPSFCVAFEIDGMQHSKYNKFLHGSRRNFQKQRDNDHIKTEWCAENNIKLYRIKPDMTVTRELILDMIKGEEQ